MTSGLYSPEVMYTLQRQEAEAAQKNLARHSMGYDLTERSIRLKTILWWTSYRQTDREQTGSSLGMACWLWQRRIRYSWHFIYVENYDAIPKHGLKYCHFIPNVWMEREIDRRFMFNSNTYFLTRKTRRENNPVKIRRNERADSHQYAHH